MIRVDFFYTRVLQSLPGFHPFATGLEGGGPTLGGLIAGVAISIVVAAVASTTFTLVLWLLLLLLLLLLLSPEPAVAEPPCSRFWRSSSCCFRNRTQGTHSVMACSRNRVSSLVVYSCVQFAIMARWSRCWGVRYGLGWPSGLRAPHRLQMQHTEQCHRPGKIEGKKQTVLTNFFLGQGFFYEYFNIEYFAENRN